MEEYLKTAETEADLPDHAVTIPDIDNTRNRRNDQYSNEELIDTDFSGVEIDGAINDPGENAPTLEDIAPGLAAVNDTDHDADIYTVNRWTDEYGTERVALETREYDPELVDVIKFNWDATHHAWNPDDEHWEIDADALPRLADELERNGYTPDF